MSNIEDDLAPQLAVRLKTGREKRNWSLADLAEHSGVSKAMLSKIEREETSPTAVILLKIATAFGMTLAELLAPAAVKPQRLLRAADQPQWRDPATKYLRRQVFQSADNPMELVEVHLPARARVAIPAGSYSRIWQVVWVLSGALSLRLGAEQHRLRKGDRLEFGPPVDTEFHNTTDTDCRYLVALIRR